MTEESTPQHSLTSILVAAGRALGARDPDPSVRNPDYLAEVLLGDVSQLGLSHPTIDALSGDYEAALANPEIASTVRMMMVRTRAIDDRMVNAIRNGATQVVVLGAGWDTRSYRLPRLLGEEAAAQVQVFEVDRPQTQQLKRARVDQALGGAPPNVHFVAVDFRVDDLAQKLRQAGFRSGEQAFFIMEGLVMYLPEEAVRGNLQFVAKQAPGSSVLFDSVYASVIGWFSSIVIEKLPEAARAPVQRWLNLEQGEPWMFGVPETSPGTGEAEFVQQCGLEFIEKLPIQGGITIQRYLTRPDGSTVGNLPASPLANGYCLFEARVP